MNVLIIEPSESVADSLSSMLSGFDYTFEVATTGEEAWRLIHEKVFDIIISEWEFTGMNGPQLCRYVRESDAGGYTYFILCSKRTNSKDLVKGIDAGADDYISRPFDLAEVRARLKAGRRILELERSLCKANKKLLSGLDQAAFSLHSMLPPKRMDSELKVDWLFRPCSIIGGDLFKVFGIDENHWGIYAMDIAGHGVASSFLAVSLANMLTPRKSIDYYDSSGQNDWSCCPQKVVSALNERFPIDDNNSLYATLFYAVIDRRTLEMRWVRAGYPPVIHCCDSKTVFLNDGDPPVGMFSDYKYSEYVTQLSPNDRLCVYSDGILEMTRQGGKKMFGINRLSKEIKKRVKVDFDRLVQEMDSTLLNYRGTDQFDDDISFLAIEIGEAALSKAV